MSIEKGKNDGEKVWCECLHCKRHTKHTVLASVFRSDYCEESDVQYWDDYEIVQCDGCEAICFRQSSTNSLAVHSDSDDLIPSIKSYPEPSPKPHEGAVYITDEVYSMPGIVQSIYSQTLGAIQHRLPILAGIGIRSIVEAICKDQKAKGGTLQKKIDDLVTMSLLTQTGADILHGLRLIGNTAAHEIRAPDKNQVAAAMKVIDHLLIGAYVIPEEAKVLPVPTKNRTGAAGRASKKVNTK